MGPWPPELGPNKFQEERSGASNGKVKLSHTRYQALGPELIPVYRRASRR